MCHKMSSMLSLMSICNTTLTKLEKTKKWLLKNSLHFLHVHNGSARFWTAALEISARHKKRNAFKYTNGSMRCDLTNSKQSISLFVVYDLGNLLGVICFKIKQET